MDISTTYDALRNHNVKEEYTLNIYEPEADWPKFCRALYPELFSLKMPNIKKVIFNPPATVVMWSDGTKTVVKARKGKKKAETDEFSEEVGLAMAVAKRYFGSRSAFVKAVEGGKRPMGETSAPKRTLTDFVEEINDAIKVPKKPAKKG